MEKDDGTNEASAGEGQTRNENGKVAPKIEARIQFLTN